MLSVTLCDPMNCSLLGSSVHGDSPGKNTRVGCHAFLQGIFLAQGLIRLCYVSYIGFWVVTTSITWEVCRWLVFELL